MTRKCFHSGQGESTPARGRPVRCPRYAAIAFEFPLPVFGGGGRVLRGRKGVNRCRSAELRPPPSRITATPLPKTGEGIALGELN